MIKYFNIMGDIGTSVILKLEQLDKVEYIEYKNISVDFFIEYANHTNRFKGLKSKQRFTCAGTNINTFKYRD